MRTVNIVHIVRAILRGRRFYGDGWGWMGMDGDGWGWMGMDGDGWGGVMNHDQGSWPTKLCFTIIIVILCENSRSTYCAFGSLSDISVTYVCCLHISFNPVLLLLLIV